MNTLYEELGSIMGTLEAEEAALETTLLNGKNEKANRYIKSALDELRASLSRIYLMLTLNSQPAETTNKMISIVPDQRCKSERNRKNCVHSGPGV